MKQFCIFSVFLFISVVTGQSGVSRDESCQELFDVCEFRFEGFPNSIPTWDVSGQADIAISTRIVSKNNSMMIGIVNTNNNPSQFIFARAYYNITLSGMEPTQFKAYTIFVENDEDDVNEEQQMILGSGIGHQVFQRNLLRTAKDKCVRVFISQYQILNMDGTSYNVRVNANHPADRESKCLVFYTAA